MNYEIESIGPDLIKVICGQSRCSKYVGANVNATDKGPLLAFTRCLGTGASHGVKAVGSIGDMAVNRLDWRPPDPYETAVDLLRADHQHPNTYDGLWCPEHKYRALDRTELLAALDANRRTIRTRPQR